MPSPSPFRPYPQSAPRFLAWTLCLGLTATAAAGAPLGATPTVGQSQEPRLGELLKLDARQVFTAPARWSLGEWGAAGLAVGGLAALADHEHGDVGAETEDQHLTVGRFDVLGAQGSLAVLGGFYLAGAAFHDEHSKNVAIDGAIASLLASGIVTPALKEIVGRSRPRQSASGHDFNPFSGRASFPSGHTTQAFAVASVVASEYSSPWVKGVAYGLAGLVGAARVERDAHYLSDVLAGGLIGTLVGREVAHTNQSRRGELTVIGSLEPTHPGYGIGWRWSG